jgi:hypothetical protein
MQNSRKFDVLACHFSLLLIERAICPHVGLARIEMRLRKVRTAKLLKTAETMQIHLRSVAERFGARTSVDANATRLERAKWWP